MFSYFLPTADAERSDSQIYADLQDWCQVYTSTRKADIPFFQHNQLTFFWCVKDRFVHSLSIHSPTLINTSLFYNHIALSRTDQRFAYHRICHNVIHLEDEPRFPYMNTLLDRERFKV
ncbi:hypothetical protein P9112_000579 [Eukaryota sp. TZLM1-RC]